MECYTHNFRSLKRIHELFIKNDVKAWLCEDAVIVRYNFNKFKITERSYNTGEELTRLMLSRTEYEYEIEYVPNPLVNFILFGGILYFIFNHESLLDLAILGLSVVLGGFNYQKGNKLSSELHSVLESFAQSNS